MKNPGLLLIGIIALLMFTEPAEVKAIEGFFGGSDEINHIQELSLKSKDGKSLNSGFMVTNIFFSAGVGLSTNSVLGVRGKSNSFFSVSEGDNLKNLQGAGLLPTPLPGYSVPFIEYLLGFSLWLILLVIGGALLMVSKLRGPSADLDDGDDYVGARQEHEEFREQTLGLYRRLMVMMMVVDNHIHPAEIETIKDIYKKLTDREFPEAELPGSEEISFDETVEEVISQHKENLNRTEKEIILLSIFLVGAADEKIREEESELLRNTAALFGFSPGGVNEVHKVALEDQEDE